MIRTPVRHSHQLGQLHQACQASGLPWVSYRLPGETEPITSIQLDPELAYFDSNAAGGFVISPFDFPEKKAFWLKNDLTLQGFAPDLQFARTAQLRPAQLLVLAKLHEQFKKNLPELACSSLPPADRVHQTLYERQVEAALLAINAGKLEKVVLSRTETIPLNENQQPVQLFEALCALYPAAFVSIYQLPGIGCWIGASPELLLARHGEQVESMSLAGTLTQPQGEAVWQSKEQHEQQIVTRYIAEQFRACGLDVSIGEQETIQAGQVYHLRNRISAKGQATVYELVHRLHPTPAICGYPVAAARAFIHEHEQHNREFYAGFLGPVDEQGDARLYVNLRAARLEKTQARLYLGGGIVAGSQPTAEWEETRAKAATLLAAIHHAGIST